MASSSGDAKDAVSAPRADYRPAGVDPKASTFATVKRTVQ